MHGLGSGNKSDDDVIAKYTHVKVSLVPPSFGTRMATHPNALGSIHAKNLDNSNLNQAAIADALREIRKEFRRLNSDVRSGRAETECIGPCAQETG